MRYLLQGRVDRVMRRTSRHFGAELDPRTDRVGSLVSASAFGLSTLNPLQSSSSIPAPASVCSSK